MTIQDKHSIKDSGKSCGGYGSGLMWPQPSKDMVAALEAQGLDIVWPEYIYVPIKGTFTPLNGREKSVLIDLTGSEKSISASDVDRTVANCLYAAYMEFAWRYEAERDIDEMKRNSDVSLDNLVRILEDKQEQERLLYRFFVAAQTIVNAQLMPPGEREAMIDKAFYFPPEMEGEIETYLEKVCPTLEPGTGAWESIVVPLARNLGICEDSSDNVKCGDKCLANGTRSTAAEQ